MMDVFIIEVEDLIALIQNKENEGLSIIQNRKSAFANYLILFSIIGVIKMNFKSLECETTKHEIHIKEGDLLCIEILKDS